MIREKGELTSRLVASGSESNTEANDFSGRLPNSRGKSFRGSDQSKEPNDDAVRGGAMAILHGVSPWHDAPGLDSPSGMVRHQGLDRSRLVCECRRRS